MLGSVSLQETLINNIDYCKGLWIHVLTCQVKGYGTIKPRALFMLLQYAAMFPLTVSFPWGIINYGIINVLLTIAIYHTVIS